MKFEIYQEASRTLTGDRDWRWRLRANNNEIIASGEGFRNKQDCLDSIELVRSTDGKTPIVEQGRLASLLINPT